MTITTYYANCNITRRNAQAEAIINFVNDLTESNGDCHSWDAVRAHIDALIDTDAQKQLGITIEADVAELVQED